jgi:hypothetical protein
MKRALSIFLSVAVGIWLYCLVMCGRVQELPALTLAGVSSRAEHASAATAAEANAAALGAAERMSIGLPAFVPSAAAESSTLLVAGRCIDVTGNPIQGAEIGCFKASQANAPDGVAVATGLSATGKGTPRSENSSELQLANSSNGGSSNGGSSSDDSKQVWALAMA